MARGLTAPKLQTWKPNLPDELSLIMQFGCQIQAQGTVSTYSTETTIFNAQDS